MTSILVVLACVALSLIAAAGVAAPFRRPRVVRSAPGPSADGSGPGVGSGSGRRRALRVGTPTVVAGIALIAVTVPFVLGAVRRSPATQAASSPVTAIEGFRQQVAEHPNDIPARLELGFLLLGSGDASGAAQQYVAVLARDPANAEARTQLAWILLGAERPRQALRQVDQALSTRPDYAEALWVRGVILLQGLHRPGAAVKALDAYLAASPYGAHRQAAAELLRRARTNDHGNGG